MGKPHALLLPYPAQGHVIPLMELAHCLVDRGFKITFVNTEFNHERLVAALPKELEGADQIHLVTIPDGLGPGEDRNDFLLQVEAMLKFMPGFLEALIEETDKESEDKITCFIADVSIAWSFEVAGKKGFRLGAFWPANAGTLATMLSIPWLIEEGIIGEDGTVKRREMIKLSPGMPAMSTARFIWNGFGDSKTGEVVFNYMVRNNQALEFAERIICNSIYELEQTVFTYVPNILPVGPLLTGQRSGKLVGHFWPEDATCTTWLDEQPANSVVYVAFGSFTIFNQRQFQELAHGLEVTGRPFLWVVRPGLTDGEADALPRGFRDKVRGRGRMVGWCPQQKVLAHPSIACFISHCGWNSTMEGVRNGVPFLCWPYFADQFLNQSYISDVWRTGLAMAPDDSGIVSSIEIKSKVEELLANDEFRGRAMALKEMASESVRKGGSSFENLNSFVDAMKEL